MTPDVHSAWPLGDGELLDVAVRRRCIDVQTVGVGDRSRRGDLRGSHPRRVRRRRIRPEDRACVGIDRNGLPVGRRHEERIVRGPVDPHVTQVDRRRVHGAIERHLLKRHRPDVVRRDPRRRGGYAGPADVVGEAGPVVAGGHGIHGVGRSDRWTARRIGDGERPHTASVTATTSVAATPPTRAMDATPLSLAAHWDRPASMFTLTRPSRPGDAPKVVRRGIACATCLDESAPARLGSRANQSRVFSSPLPPTLKPADRQCRDLSAYRPRVAAAFSTVELAGPEHAFADKRPGHHGSPGAPSARWWRCAALSRQPDSPPSRRKGPIAPW